MFHLIGLGLGDPEDISQKVLDVIKHCEKLYLEAYTSVLLNGGKESLVSTSLLINCLLLIWRMLTYPIMNYNEDQIELTISVCKLHEAAWLATWINVSIKVANVSIFLY